MWAKQVEGREKKDRRCKVVRTERKRKGSIPKFDRKKTTNTKSQKEETDPAIRKFKSPSFLALESK